MCQDLELCKLLFKGCEAIVYAAWEDSLELTRPWNTWKNNLAMAEKLGTCACSVFQMVVYRQTL